MQSAEQSRFAGFFAPIAPQSAIQDGAHRQRENDEQTRQRKTQTRLLALGLRIGRLVFRRVGHGHGGAVDNLDIATMPQPTHRRLQEEVVADSSGQASQNGFRQALPRLAIGPGVGRDPWLSRSGTFGQQTAHRLT